MFPYLSTAGFRRRTRMPDVEVSYVESNFPGFLEEAIASRSSYINGRLRKRYGNGNANGNSLPMGQACPTLLRSGTTPPSVTLSGQPTLGSIRVRIEVTAAGPRGTAVIRCSTDGGFTWSAATTTAATISLGFGVTANFPDESYSLDNIYIADTPVPEIVLRWLTVLVTQDLYDKRGANSQDASLANLREDVERTYDEIKEAADGKDGLFDIPTTEDADSAVTTGFVLGYSESSPYAWTDVEACAARAEDQRGGCGGCNR